MSHLNRRERIGKLRYKVGSIISDQAMIAYGSINANMILTRELELDELDIVELMMALEEKFGINITDEDAEKWITVDDILNYITKVTL